MAAQKTKDSKPVGNVTPSFIMDSLYVYTVKIIPTREKSLQLSWQPQEMTTYG